jgi:hypothetical protein
VMLRTSGVLWCAVIDSGITAFGGLLGKHGFRTSRPGSPRRRGELWWGATSTPQRGRRAGPNVPQAARSSTPLRRIWQVSLSANVPQA